MNVDKIIIDSIRESTSQVFSTMLDIAVTAGEPYLETTGAAATDGLVSFVGIAGPWVGTGSIVCQPPLACRICAQMLMIEVPSVNEDVLDAVSEITNMIVGNVKTALEGYLGPLGLGIPTVIFGKNFMAKSARRAEWHVVPFDCGGETLLVKLYLIPGDPAHQPGVLSSSHHCPVDV